MSTLEQRWEERLMREQYTRARQDARNRRAAAQVDPSTYWQAVASMLTANQQEQDDGAQAQAE